MSKNIKKIALIGCGNMGNYYAHNISKTEKAEIISCCDPSESKLNRFMEKWNIPSGTKEWKNLLPREDGSSKLDGIINCSFDSLHEEIFETCTRKNIPLLTEKPFAVSFKTLNSFSPEVLNQQILVINFSKRSIPAVHAVREFLDDNGLGKIHRIELHYRQGWVLNHDYGDWHNTSAWFWRLTDEFSNFGVLGDLGSHLFDLASCFCGPVESVSCGLNRLDKGSKEIRGHKLNSVDEGVCFLQMQNGASALINMTRTAAGEKDCLELMINGEKGTIKVSPEQNKDSYDLFLIKKGVWETVSCPARPLKSLESFIEQISGKSNNFPGIKEAIENHVIIEAAAASSQQGRRISIDAFGENQLGDIWQKTVQQK